MAETSSESLVPTVTIPKQWPPEVVELYEPIRELGRGGFASVLLARKKDSTEETLHAIKIVGSKHATRQEVGYAHREMEILAELSHPNIVQLIQSWEPPKESHMCAAVMSLSFHPGPTLDHLLREGGALSVVVARVLSAQLVDAVGYLHSRAVVHRDVKPDNCVVTFIGNRNDLWDYKMETTSSTKQDAEQPTTDSTSPDWIALRARWHLTLLDFGFARALTPKDLKKEKPKATPDPSKQTNGSTTNALDVSSASNTSARSNKSLSRSTSRLFTRSMSAVGNRTYAAPEILRGVHNRTHLLNPGDASRHPIDVTETLSEHVSFYGLMADAYSVGSTIQYMLTGAPPNEDVDEVISFEKNPVVVLCRFLCGICATKEEKSERRVIHRRLTAVPKEAKRLVQSLRHPNSHERASIRAGRLYPWINDPLEGQDTFDFHKQKVNYLSFALEAAEATETETK